MFSPLAVSTRNGHISDPHTRTYAYIYIRVKYKKQSGRDSFKFNAFA